MSAVWVFGLSRNTGDKGTLGGRWREKLHIIKLCQNWNFGTYKIFYLVSTKQQKQSSVHQISLFREACREPTRGTYSPRRAYIHSQLIYHIQSWHKVNSLHIQNRYTLLTCTPHQVGINRGGQPLTRTLLRLYGGQKKPARKNPFGEKIWQEIWVGTMAHTQSSWQPVLRGFTVKENKFSN